MAITVTTEPADYALAKTEVKVGLTTDNLFSSAGTKAVLQILETSFSSALFPLEDETLTISFGTTELVFTFKDSPDDSGLQLQSGVGSPSGYGLILMASLKRNFDLLENWDYSYEYDINDDTLIILTAVEKKLWDTVNITGTVTGLNYPTITDGTDPVKRENFTILLDVFNEVTLNESEASFPKFDLLTRLNAIPDDEGLATFDISAALKLLVSTPFPNMATTIDDTNYISVVDGALRRYHLRYCERFGATPASQIFRGWPSDDDSAPSGYFSKVLNAGAKNTTRVAFNTAFSTSYRATSLRKFLTYRSTTVNLPQASPLMFDGLSVSNNTFKIEVTLYYTDGNTKTYTLGTFTKADSLEAIVRFRMSYSDLRIEANKNVGKTVMRYTAKVLNSAGSTQLFETITVNVLPNKKYDRYFLFENSLGGVDVLYASGNLSTELEFNSQVTQNYAVDPSNNLYNGEFSEANTQTQEVYELHSGFVSKAELQYLKDFLYSTNRFLVNGTLLERVNIPSQSVSMYTDQSQLFALKLKMNQAWIEKTL